MQEDRIWLALLRRFLEHQKLLRWTKGTNIYFSWLLIILFKDPQKIKK